MKHVAMHEEEEKEHKAKFGNLWIKQKGAHDCDMDPNSKSPLASCRLKHPPQDNY